MTSTSLVALLAMEKPINALFFLSFSFASVAFPLLRRRVRFPPVRVGWESPGNQSLALAPCPCTGNLVRPSKAASQAASSPQGTLRNIVPETCSGTIGC